jgi:hypothetical protein
VYLLAQRALQPALGHVDAQVRGDTVVGRFANLNTFCSHTAVEPASDGER